MGLYALPMVVIRLTDPPVHVGSGGCLQCTHFRVQPPQHGRFIFTEAVAVQVDEGPVNIWGCEFSQC